MDKDTITKAIIMNNIMQELISLKTAMLYGIREKNLMIISSLKQKTGLVKLGVFYSSKQDCINAEPPEPMIFSMDEGQLTCSYSNKDSTHQRIEVITVNYATDFNKRNKGIVDPSALQDVTATIVGLGSGGSAIAVDLLRSGVINLILIEFDTVEVSNLCRSVYDISDIGRKKTEAMLEKLLRINPCANIQIYEENVLELGYSKLTEIINASDLIIEATDSAKTKLLINGFSRNNTPVIYPAVYDSGRGGDILFTLPGYPCYECVFKSIIPEMMEKKKTDWDYTNDKPKSMPGLLSDIQVVVARTVKLALGLLTSDREDSFIKKIIEPDCTLLFISNEKSDKEGCLNFDQPFTEYWEKTRINPECSCQLLQ